MNLQKQLESFGIKKRFNTGKYFVGEISKGHTKVPARLESYIIYQGKKIRILKASFVLSNTYEENSKTYNKVIINFNEVKN
jgi:hypothetical protein